LTPADGNAMRVKASAGRDVLMFREIPFIAAQPAACGFRYFTVMDRKTDYVNYKQTYVCNRCLTWIHFSFWLIKAVHPNYFREDHIWGRVSWCGNNYIKKIFFLLLHSASVVWLFVQYKILFSWACFVAA
jgi:hypothetical protein